MNSTDPRRLIESHSTQESLKVDHPPTPGYRRGSLRPFPRLSFDLQSPVSRFGMGGRCVRDLFFKCGNALEKKLPDDGEVGGMLRLCDALKHAAKECESVARIFGPGSGGFSHEFSWVESTCSSGGCWPVSASTCAIRLRRLSQKPIASGSFHFRRHVRVSRRARVRGSG